MCLPPQPAQEEQASTCTCMIIRLASHRGNAIYIFAGQKIKQQVLIYGAIYETMPVTSRVLQGSVLRPLLFLIDIDGVTTTPIHCLTGPCMLIINMLLYRHIQTPQDYQMLASCHLLIVSPTLICYLKRSN